MKIANRDARSYVQKCKAFEGSNLYATWTSPYLYVVYSYGTHYPMFVYDCLAEEWFENSLKWSQSTGRQRTQARPLTDTTPMSHEDMQIIACEGIVGLIEREVA
jgi:hypothetical protein